MDTIRVFVAPPANVVRADFRRLTFKGTLKLKLVLTSYISSTQGVEYRTGFTLPSLACCGEIAASTVNVGHKALSPRVAPDRSHVGADPASVQPRHEGFW